VLAAVALWPRHAAAPVAVPASPVTQAPAAEAAPAAPSAEAASAAFAEPAAQAPSAAEPPVAEAPPTPTAPPKAAPRPAAPARARNSAPARETKPQPAAPVVNGTVQLAISPWGAVEVDGRDAGTTPPLARLTLAEGQHTITIRNEDFPAYTLTVQVSEDKPVTVRHRFGSGS